MLVVLFLLVIGLAVLFLVGVEFCSYAYITKLYGYNLNNQLIFPEKITKYTFKKCVSSCLQEYTLPMHS